MHRFLFAIVLLALLAQGLASGASVSAAPVTVTGTITSKEKIALTPAAVAVVTLVDQQAGPDAGVIIGQQRIDGAVLPQAFAIAVADGVVDPSHSYALHASIVDGGKTMQTIEPVPVVTGGPVSGINLPVVSLSAAATGTVAGQVTRTDRSALTPQAVTIAVLVNQAKGTMVARQVIPTVTAEPIAFQIPYDPGIIDPAVTYVALALIVDGTRTWQSTQGSPAIVNGVLVDDVAVSVAPVGSTPAPTAAPTASPTETSSASPSPTPSPTPSSTPTAEPTSGVISGTLVYNEEHELTPEARSVVVLVEGSTRPSQGTIVASTVIEGGAKPVPFELTYEFASIAEDTPYRLHAGIVDGDLAWVTPIGVAVSVPQAELRDVVLPLEFRPDLLKAAVTGTISGVGLDPTADSHSWGAAMVVRVDTGETVGFQMINEPGPVPVPFSVPYDPLTIDPGADYIAKGTIFDGFDYWTTAAGVPVITRDNPRSDVQVAVVPEPSPSPTATPSPSPTATPSPSGAGTEGSGDGGIPWGTFLLIFILGAGGAAAAFAWKKRQEG